MVLFSLAGCGWFGGAAPPDDITTPIEEDNPLIPKRSGIFAPDPEDNVYQGTTIDAILDLAVERVPGGILILATGRSATQGAYNARLTPVNLDGAPENGVLTYQFQAEYMPGAGGAPETREVTVARRLTDQELGNTRTIRVEARQNALQKRR